MATKERLEQALRNADKAGDVVAAKRFAAAIRNGEYDQPQQDEKGFLAQAGDVALEGMAAVNRGAAGLVDFAALPFNAALELSGADTRIPSLTQAAAPATTGNFMQDGLAKEIVRRGGEAIPASLAVGGMMRAAAAPLIGQAGSAAALPTLTAASEGTGAGALRQLGSSTVAQDIGFGALSGGGGAVGQEIGGDTGEIVGAIAAPLTVAGGSLALKKMFDAGKSGIDSFFASTKNMSDDGAATMLAEAMVREGLSPDDVAKRVAAMGEQGMLADTGNNFSRLLRAASNKVPRIEGVAAQKFSGRQAGQATRLSGALDDGTGTPLLNVDDEIARLENTMSPKISELYSAAKDRGFSPSKRLRALLEGDNSIGRAAKEAERNLADYRAAGQQVTNMSLIDETKKVVDAQIAKAIREGDKGTSSRLLQLKKVMVDEADAAAPEYAQARSMFAGKQQLKNAAELGQDFFKVNSRELKSLTETFGESEKRMYKLGAKQAIMDRFDNINADYDLVKRTFGKNGDAEKLRTLFDKPEQYEAFTNILEREANWVLTRRAAQANSTTAKQMLDEGSAQEAFANAREALTSPMGAANVLGKIVGGLSKKKGSQEYVRSLELAGDILLESGLKPEAVRDLLKRGSAPMIEKALKVQTEKVGTKIPAISGSLLQNQQQDRQEATQ